MSTVMVRDVVRATVECEDIDSTMTALMFAAMVGDETFVRRQLEGGSDPNVVNRRGRTARWYAHKYGYGRIEEMLTAVGATH